MKTDVITLTGDLDGMDLAMEAEEKFAVYYGITGREALHLRLLTEETLSMIHGIFDAFRGQFWLESEKTKTGLICRICLSAEKQVTREQETQMLSVASSGKNQSAKGIAGKIREMLRRSLQNDTAEEAALFEHMNDTLSANGPSGAGFAVQDKAYWSLQSYKQSIPKGKTEEWDELEKSIIAKLADEVKVWLETDSTKVVIEKRITV